MIRKIIKIDEEKCNGCGLCVTACHEGAIAMVNGKAKLVRDDYCDGLGACLPVCPTDALSFEERDAAAFDEDAVKSNLEKTKHAANPPESAHKKEGCGQGGCPGTNLKTFAPKAADRERPAGEEVASRLGQWPVQIKLVPVNAPYFNGAKLLIAADCAAYAYGDFHNKFMKGKITLIGCPKLDEGDYSDKLTEIIRRNDIKSVTVARMEVPCCGGLENAVKRAIIDSGKFLPWQVVTIGTDGIIIEE